MSRRLGAIGIVCLSLGCPATVDDGDGGDGPADDGATVGMSQTSAGDGASADGSGLDCSGCGDGQWCDWSTNRCGEGALDEGDCYPVPEGCGEIYAPVCACDGNVYGNDCEAQAAGVDVDVAGECEPPAGMFPCLWAFCDAGLSYCEIQGTDIANEAPTVSCNPLPTDCGDAPSCDCLADAECAEFSCEAQGDGLVVVCPGG